MTTDASGHIGLAADVSVRLSHVDFITLIFETSNPNHQVGIAFYDGSTLLRTDTFNVPLNNMRVVNDATKDVEHFVISATPNSNDVYLMSVCSP